MAWMPTLYFLNLILISQTFSIRNSSKPEIWLSSFSEVDSVPLNPAPKEFQTNNVYENGYISKNDTDYVVFDSTSVIQFSCRAAFPVVWNIPNLSQLQKVPYFVFSSEAVRKSTFPKGSLRPRNQYFETVVKVECSTNNFFSVNITCESFLGQTHGLKSSSVHVFYAGKELMENVGETINASVTENHIILPCRPCTPNVTVFLEKQEFDQYKTESWVRILPDPDYATFSPKTGFVLNKNRGQYLGLYRCLAFSDSADDNRLEGSSLENQIVYVNVSKNEIQTKDEDDPKFETIHVVTGNASISYNGYHTGQNTSFTVLDDDPYFCCCTGDPESPPAVVSEKCNDLLQCNLLKLTELATVKRAVTEILKDPQQEFFDENPEKGCQKTFLDFPGLLVFCKGKNVEYLEFFRKSFHPSLLPVANRSEMHNRSDDIFSMDYAVAAAQNERNILTSQKIFFTVGYPRTAKQLAQFSPLNKPVVENSFLFSKEFSINSEIGFDEMLTDEEAFYAQLERNENYKKIHSDTIFEYSREIYYELEPLVGICFGWSIRYAEGAHLTVLWRNGTKTAIEERREREEPYKIVYFESGMYTAYADTKKLTIRFGIPVMAQRDMEALECWMPQVDTDQWDVLRKNLTILESSPPQFSQEFKVEEENLVYVYLEDNKEIQVEYSLLRGNPKPLINITKDGQVVFYWEPYQDAAYHSNAFKSSINVTMTGKKETWNGNKTDGGIRIKVIFVDFTVDMQGVYKCTAENVRGKVTQVFRIVVAEKYHRIYLTLLILLLLTLIFTGIAGWYFRQRIKVRPLTQRVANLINT